MRTTAIAGFLTLVLLGAWAVPSNPQKNPLPAATRENERRSFAVNVLRAINASELDYKKQHAVYANWEALYNNGYFSSAGTKYISEDFPTVSHALYGNTLEIVPGWKLRLNVSGSGKAYDAILEDANDLKCGFAAVTDERGFIRQSKFVDCPL